MWSIGNFFAHKVISFFFFYLQEKLGFSSTCSVVVLGENKMKILAIALHLLYVWYWDNFKFLREVEWLQLTSILFSIFSQKDSAPWTSSSPKTAQFWSPQMWLAGAWTFHMWMLLLILIYQHILRYKHAYNV